MPAPLTDGLFTFTPAMVGIRSALFEIGQASRAMHNP